MDLGSELIKDIDDLLKLSNNIAVFERSSTTVNSGLFIACEKGNPLIKELLHRYDMLKYEDSDSFRMNHTTNVMLTKLLMEKGLKRIDKTQILDNWIVLSSEYFNPIYSIGGFHIKKSTYSVHRYAASWREPKEAYKDSLAYRLSFFIGNRLGNIFARVATEIKFDKNFFDALRNVCMKIFL